MYFFFSYILSISSPLYRHSNVVWGKIRMTRLRIIHLLSPLPLFLPVHWIQPLPSGTLTSCSTTSVRDEVYSWRLITTFCLHKYLQSKSWVNHCITNKKEPIFASSVMQFEVLREMNTLLIPFSIFSFCRTKVNFPWPQQDTSSDLKSHSLYSSCMKTPDGHPFSRAGRKEARNSFIFGDWHDVAWLQRGLWFILWHAKKGNSWL